MKVKEYYRLELHWYAVVKEKGDRCSLVGAYFCGPVLKNMQALQPGDSIVLDFTPQYSSIISKHYFVRFTWGEIFGARDKISLKNAVLHNTQVNDISNLQDTDYILIDTSKHEEKIHMYNLVYRSAVLNKDGKEYMNNA